MCILYNIKHYHSEWGLAAGKKREKIIWTTSVRGFRFALLYIHSICIVPKETPFTLFNSQKSKFMKSVYYYDKKIY